MHGLFESSDTTNALLAWAGAKNDIEVFDYAAFRDKEIDRLADSLEANLKLNILPPLCGIAGDAV